ncbi:LuxR family transcriptional regulator [Pectobacterium parvum]|uniref:N-acylhomoserine lactone-dependent transcriptional regulator ExpR n=2 Tax=Pectobacterium TaxID=122277 RepID=A0A510DQB2_PECCC|nr:MULTISPECIES: LuxR family transcriptional regulator [Pectobacterium]BBE36843.1 N-acylhomoserine lactone-dependent transcriptional regulator ExpR [Pectobacterium carotovorum subsp. carotovorum]KFX16643.1 LuxR family transcriptional regulator [Pectobacterium parvum]KHS95556.1 LuxR family transcriptional regulator [Pectobacterium parvum]MCU1800591.1 LuxR family transcriptional regulator [Pectobacterium parvum]QHQ23978.1 LuxR family transcriptional regulator [Pectobacterium parvum]
MSPLFSSSEIISRVIKGHFNENLEHYDGIKFSFMVLNKKNPSEMIIISSYPDEWVNLYKENKYQHIDPVVLASFNKISPFSWEKSLVINTRLQLAKIFDLSKKYNIINGYTFVLHDHGDNLAMLSIIVDSSYPDDVDTFIEEKKDTFQMLLINAYEKIISLCREMIGNKKKLNNKEIFSQRENEILYWASMGKTYLEVAIILGIKTSTVKFHIGNVVKKLGVLNAKHAIRLGVELQLIKPVQ